MPDPNSRRRPGPLPFVAILVLVALLSAFLWFQWDRRDREPVVVKLPPADPPVVEAAVPEETPPAPVAVQPPVEAEAAPEEPEAEPAQEPEPEAPKPKPAVEPKEPDPAPAPDGFEAKLGEVRKALEEKRWDEAEAGIRAALKIRDDMKAVAPLIKAVKEGRAVQAARAREQFEAAWAKARAEAEKAQAVAKWEEGLAALNAFAKAHPEAKEDGSFRRLSGKLERSLEAAEKDYGLHMDLARQHLEAGRYPEAIAEARKAVVNHPARKPEAGKLQAAARERMAVTGMVRIPSTTCWIGSDARDEGGRRQVKLKPFLIDKYEVTCAEYQAFLNATNREGPPYWSGPGRRLPPGNMMDHPVFLVTYADAEAYAQWAGKRLPTAEEWEVAARGPDGREFPWGDAFQKDEKEFHANTLEYWKAPGRKTYPITTPKDAFDGPNNASPFGVQGMGGNVWEWTSTVRQIKAPGGPIQGRILKGGSYMTPAKAARCANVYVEDPALAQWDIGFRCVRDIK